ncbi:hypothetical protein NBRC116589_21320 [Ruegeria sp. HU-ET01832]|uniref:hypothetical protein n=1 Tax=Ruegeria sp. HU-ET01832 TaxID=3135906 RepID=UPI0031095E74
MSFEAERVWMTKVFGDGGQLTQNLQDEIDNLIAREKAIEVLNSSEDFGETKQALRDGLRELGLVVEKRNHNLNEAMALSNPVLGAAWNAADVKFPKTIKVLAQVDGDKIPVEIEDSEWDSFADRAGEFVGLKKGEETFEFKSEAAATAIREIFDMLRPLVEKSNELAAMVDKKGERLFSDRDIEKELWTPLVREGVIPSNLVPDSFSEGMQVFKNAAAVYTELMAREEGKEMKVAGVDKALRRGKLLMTAANLGASQALHYANISITEASREDLAKFINFKEENIALDEDLDVDEMPDEYNDLVIEGKTVAEIKALPKADRPEITEADLTKAKYLKDNPNEELSYKDWLDKEEASLSEQIEEEEDPEKIEQLRNEKDGVRYEKNRLKFGGLTINDEKTLDELAADDKKVTQLQLTRAEFEAQKKDGVKDYDKWLDAQIKSAEGEEKEKYEAAKLTQQYGKFVAQDAARKCGAAAAIGAVEAAQAYRAKQEKRRDIGIQLAGAFADSVAAGITSATEAEDLTTNADTQNRQHKTKFGILAGKAGLKAVSKLTQVAEGRKTLKDPRELVVGAIADICDAAGESMSASGTKGDDGGWGDTGNDSRDEASSWGMLAKGMGLSVTMIDKMVAAAQKGDWDDFAKQVLLFTTSGPFTGTAGLIGDAVREDKDADDIEAGWGGHGSDADFAVTARIEEEHAEGQSEFGMSKYMATVNDQRDIMEETRELSKQMADESFRKDKVKVQKAYQKIRDTAKRLNIPEDQKDLKLFMSLDPGKLDPETVAVEVYKMLTVCERATHNDVRAVANMNLSKEDENKILGQMEVLGDRVDKLHDDPDGDNPETEDEIRGLYDDISKTLLKDPGFRAVIEADMEEEDAWLEDLKKQADLKRLDKFNADPKLYQEEYEKAMSAVEQLTLEVKKTEQRIKIADQASKGATGIMLAAVPAAGLIGKIRTLVMDSVKLHRRRKSLSKWSREMNAIAGSYSPYEPAVVGERDALIKGTIHDAAEVAADIAGVGAEAARLADQTHVGAAAMTSIEKIGKFLNKFWFEKYSRDRIKEGWELFLLARAEPKNRRLARQAIKVNTTLGKCVLAYGACIDGDAQARRALQSCGLTPEVFEDSDDVCQGVVEYLRAALQDKEFETIGSNADVSWLPCDIEMNIESWSMIKASAVKLKPGLDPKYFKTAEINALLLDFEIPKKGASKQELRDAARIGSDLSKALDKFRPLDTQKNLHSPMIVVTQELKHNVDVANDRIIARVAKIPDD